MKVLITGGAGFIGHHLALHMKSKGYEVLAIGNATESKRSNIELMRKSEIEFRNVDILSPSLADVFKDFGPDAVVHAAAAITVDDSKDRSGLVYHRTNVLGTINALDALLKCNTSNFVYMSTAAVYGNAAYLPIDEKHPTTPLSVYAASKLAGEAVAYSAGLYGVKTFIPRAFNAYGQAQEKSKEDGIVSSDRDREGFRPHLQTGSHTRVDIVSRLVAASGSMPPIAGDGEQTRDFISVHDLVEAIELGISRGWAGIYNIGSGVGTSMNKLTEMIMRLKGIKAEPEHMLNADVGIRDSYADISKIKALGWEPKITLEKGLKELVDNYIG